MLSLDEKKILSKFESLACDSCPSHLGFSDPNRTPWDEDPKQCQYGDGEHKEVCIECFIKAFSIDISLDGKPEGDVFNLADLPFFNN